jgi:hypothetical protein
MDMPSRIEIYSAMPYEGGEDSKINDWFHVARNQSSDHIEAIWDIETLFRPEVSEEDKPIPLLGLESAFDEVRFHYALNYTSQRYHEDLMLWAFKALKPGGQLQIISPDADWVLKYWVGDALGIDANDYIISRKENNNELEQECDALRARVAELSEQIANTQKWYQKIKFAKDAKATNEIERMLGESGIPKESIPSIDGEQIVAEIPDRVSADRSTDIDFDLWLLQQLYSSGAGEPQDTFKSIFGKRYLSDLLRKTRFIISLLQNNPENPRQMEAKVFRHASRLL